MKQKSFSGYLRSLKNSKKGVTGIMFAASLSMIAILVASGIEIARIQKVKAALNSITDAAALAGKGKQVESASLSTADAKAAAEEAAKASFAANKERLKGIATNINPTISWDSSDDSLRVYSHADATLVLGGFFSLNGTFNLSSVPVSSVAVAASGLDKYVEIAMVLDNTGSMFQTDGRPNTRFTELRNAAISFVNTIYDSATAAGRIRFSVVPWATSVNIKSEDPLGWDSTAVPATTMPDRGSRTLPSSTLPRNGNLTITGSALADMYKPTSWRGCISGEGESDTPSDAAMSGMKWKPLAVPPNPYTSYLRPLKDAAGTCQRNCVYTPDPPSPTPTPDPTPTPTPTPTPGMDGYWVPKNLRNRNFANFIQPMDKQIHGRIINQGKNIGNASKNAGWTCEDYPCTVRVCDESVAWENRVVCYQDTMKYYGSDPYSKGRRNTYLTTSSSCTNHGSYSCIDNFDEGTVTACVADPNEIAYNNSGGAWCSFIPSSTQNWTTFDPTVGPNINCPMPMLGLSGSRPQIINTINLMSPVVGGTHADVGLRWGLRTLSPRNEWATFFNNTGAKLPKIFGASNVKKVMVLITDGENTQANDFPGYWGCSDTNAPGCTGSPDASALNTKMLNWCDSIRNNYNVELYTIAVNVNNTSAVNLLKQCAGSDDRAYSVDASALASALAQIAKSINSLHLKE